jgi:transcriptional regulator with XRE-family HTH domain
LLAETARWSRRHTTMVTRARAPSSASRPAASRRGGARKMATQTDLPAEAPPPVIMPTESSLKALARQLQSLTTSVLNMAGTATDLGVTLAKSRLTKPHHKAAIDKAGSLLQDLRQTAGLTVQDLGHALGLSDPSELERIESGKVAMPFELILRAASVLGRKDPITFVMQATRAYNPELWRTLEALGVGKLVVQGAREREFANLYRARDAARALDDAQFAMVLAFVGSAFDLALDLAARSGKGTHPSRKAKS